MPEPDPPPRTHPVTIDIETVSEPINVPARLRPEPAPLLPPLRPNWAAPDSEPEEGKKAPDPATIDVKPGRKPWFKPRPRQPKAKPEKAYPTGGKRARQRLRGWAIAAVAVWAAAWGLVGGSLPRFQTDRAMAKRLQSFARDSARQAGANLPWQRQEVRDAGRAKELRAWTQEDWSRTIKELRNESRGVDHLQPTTPLEKLPLVPVWPELSTDPAEFQERLADNGLTGPQLATHFEKFAGALTELEERTSKASKAANDPSDEALQAFYERYQDKFTVPETFLVRHIFLAAHTGTPPEKVEAQRLAAQNLAQRLHGGNDGTLEDLAETFSEDEATRHMNGLLPRFSADRMPADFMDAVKAATPGELTGPVQTSLGFHIFIVEARLPARPIPFEEARAQLIRAFRQARLGIERERILDGAEAATP